MTPRLIVAWRLLGAKREAAGQLRLFAVVSHAMHADKNQAADFIGTLRAIAE
jgi:hypothetical protein